MSASPTQLNPLGGMLPGCISTAMIYGLLRSLCRPQPGGPVDLGRQMIEDALAMIALYQPRDVLEAHLVMQLVTLRCRVPRAMALAAGSEDKPAMMQRCERHAMALLRCANALERGMRLHRRELAARGEAPVSPPAWAYDLDVLEAMWRQEPPRAEGPAADPRAVDSGVTQAASGVDARGAAVGAVRPAPAGAATLTPAPAAAGTPRPRELSRQERKALFLATRAAERAAQMQRAA